MLKITLQIIKKNNLEHGVGVLQMRKSIHSDTREEETLTTLLWCD